MVPILCARAYAIGFALYTTGSNSDILVQRNQQSSFFQSSIEHKRFDLLKDIVILAGNLF